MDGRLDEGLLVHELEEVLEAPKTAEAAARQAFGDALPREEGGAGLNNGFGVVRIGCSD